MRMMNTFIRVSNLKTFCKEKILSKITYISSIIICFEEWFRELTRDGENIEIDTRVVDGDKILHNICTVLGICN